jgi:hypothetical protein
MRDIRPTKPGSSASKELYEASSGAKKKIEPVKSIEPVKKASSAGRGSKVEVTNIHVKQPLPKMYGGVDSDKKRPLFMKAPLKNKGERGNKKVTVGRNERNIVLMLAGLLLVAGVIAAIIFLPTATIVLRLKTAPLLVDEELLIAGKNEGGEKVIPGTTFYREVQVNGSVAVEGNETIGEKARGTVEIVNRTVEEQKIKEMSRLVTESDQLFYMTKHAIVPANSRTTVPLEASEPGEEGNIEPQKLNFAALDDSSQLLVYGEVTENLTGGSGEVIAVVSESDIVKAEKEAENKAKTRAEIEIREKLPTGWIIIEESWTSEMAAVEVKAEVGDKESTVEYNGRVAVQVMGVEKSVLEEKLRTALERRLDEDYMLFPGAISYSKTISDIDWEEASAKVVARVTHTTIPKISIDTLKDKLAGRSGEEAVRYLEGMRGVSSASMKLWPFWVKSIPRIEKRISLEFESVHQP